MVYVILNKSKSNNWGTPPDFYEKLNDEHHFTFDPCPFPLPDWNGLEIEWGECNFVNPPYNDIKSWSKKCREEQLKGRKSVLLIPAKTDTKYFHQWILPYAEIKFLKGRMNFISLDKKSLNRQAPFPSILCVYQTT
jgi:site-specific DNA-methyltransferase (adenine-specific)